MAKEQEVVAIERGFYGGQLREPGDTFMAAGKATWFEPANGKKAASAKKAKEAKAADESEVQATGGDEPFGDAPAPAQVQTDVVKATGGPAPDWIEPGQKI